MTEDHNLLERMTVFFGSLSCHRLAAEGRSPELEWWLV